MVKGIYFNENKTKTGIFQIIDQQASENDGRWIRLLQFDQRLILVQSRCQISFLKIHTCLKESGGLSFQLKPYINNHDLISV
jgi:hypothetical protein